MPGVQVVTGDEIFARMVILLLESAGLGPASHSTRRGGFFDRAVVDLDFVKEFRPGGRCLTVSTRPAAGADLTRPFLVDDLLSLAIRVFGEDGRPAGTGAALPPALSAGVPPGEYPAGSAREAPPVPAERGVLLDGRLIPLSDKERALYALLFSRRGQPVSRSEILDAVFPDAVGNEAEVYVSYLRAKLDYAVGRRIIRTIRGKGYVID